MDLDSIIIENIRGIVGLNIMLNFAGLGRVRQNRLEQMLDAVAWNLSIKNMGSIYMKSLFQQDFDVTDSYRSQVIERWVSFVNDRGLGVDEAIAMWAHAAKESSMATHESEQINHNDLRKEIEAKFHKLRSQWPSCRHKSDMKMSTEYNSYVHVYSRNFDISRKRSRYLRDEEESLESDWTLKHWPTKDIPFPSTESPVDTEQEELEDNFSINEEEKQTGESIAERRRPIPEGIYGAAAESLIIPQQIPGSSQDMSTPSSNAERTRDKRDLRTMLNY
ncbi:hypothetical protein FHETE_6320 [Fusarium heterosporum]|uniref:Uncharacterized protein n=1 Tax=Fusarium heterosporum TaxID=42747 RepID=A0A8H5WQ38_FUSHE|nr:hypothetical protein FHETE_6320 [Fusarium heterosporum]